MVKVDIAIVGAGMGGLALAAGLQRRGFDAHVFEASPKLHIDSTSGTVISIGKNGQTALQGLHPELCEALIASGRLEKVVSRVKIRPDGSTEKSEFPVQNSMILDTWRGGQRALARFVDPEKIHCGHVCTGYSAVPEGGELYGVQAHFKVAAKAPPSEAGEQNGLKEPLGESEIETETVTVAAKLLVGADGIRSAIRKQMVGDEPRYLRTLNWNALVEDIDESRVPGGPLERRIVAYFCENPEGTNSAAPTSHVALGYLFNAGENLTFWQYRTFDPDLSWSEALKETSFGGAGKPGAKERLLKHVDTYMGWGDVKAVIEMTDEKLIYERKLVDQPPLESWSDCGGLVVLLGDSAHAMFPGPGQGARTAFEDAHQLAVAVEEDAPGLEPDAVARAIARYEKLRIRRCNRVVSFAAEGTGLPREEIIPPEAMDLTLEGKMARWREFSNWIDQYPENPDGDPESKYFKPTTT